MPSSSGTDEAKRGRIGRIAPPAFVVLAFLVLASLSFRRLGSLFIDNGHELEAPRRILAGELPYLDFTYYWGPLAPYVNAGLYRMFGVSIDVLMWAGIASAALLAACVYLLAREFLSRWASAIVAATFLVECAFPQLMPVAIFNFVLPHNFSATYGMVAASFSVLTLLVHFRDGRAPWLIVSALLLAVTALAKMEVFFAALAPHALFLVLSIRRLGRGHLLAYGSAMAVVAAVYGAFLARVGPALWHENLGAYFNDGSRHYIRLHMGFDDVPGALGRVAVSLAATAAALGAGWGAGEIASRESVGMRARYAAVAGAGIAVFVLFALVPAHLALADLQVLIAGLLVGIVLARRVFDHVPLLVLCVFALASLARIAARVTPLHYGFFLLPPGLVVLGTLLFDVAPRVLGAAPWRRRAFAAVAVGLLGGVCVGVLRISILYFTEPRVELATRRGRLLVPPGAPELFLEDWLQTYPRGTKALAVPDGLGLLYAADLRPVGGMLSYVPMDLTAEGAEARAIQAWTAEPPEVVVWVKRDDQEVFGYRGFGIDYGVAAARWLLARYVPASDPREDYVILVRNPAAAALR